MSSVWDDQVREQIINERDEMLPRRLKDPKDLLGTEMLEFVMELAEISTDPRTGQPSHEDLLAHWRCARDWRDQWTDDAQQELEADWDGQQYVGDLRNVK
jgi:hypothetical protein